MLKGLVKKFKSAVDDTEEIDEEFFAQVMKEIKDGYKEEGLEGKSIAMSGGEEKKANSIYMRLRAEALQEKDDQKKANYIYVQSRAEVLQEKSTSEHLEVLQREVEEARETQKIWKSGNKEGEEKSLVDQAINILSNQRKLKDLGY